LTGYNVKNVVVMRKAPGSLAETIASIGASAGQTDFNLTWLADVPSTDPKGSAFYAFVDTTVRVPFKLEIAKVSIAATAYSGTVKYNSTVTDTVTTEFLGSGEGVTFLGIGIETIAIEGQVAEEDENVGNVRFPGSRVLKFNSITGGITGSYNRQYTRSNEPQLSGPCYDYSKSETISQEHKWESFDLSRRNLLGEFSGSATAFELNTNFGRVDGVSESRGTLSRSYGAFKQCSNQPKAPFSETYIRSTLAFKNLGDGNKSWETRGAVSIDPKTGEKVIILNKSDDYINEISKGVTTRVQYSINLNLSNKPPSTDLELGIVTPARATAGSTFTYAVNIRNKSDTIATGIRAEFYLPKGFTVLATPGWTGCTTLQTTAICTAPSLAAKDRRALLIDVQAPLAAGIHIVSAKVSSNESDLNPSDNGSASTTLLLEPEEK
jgi:uncharacterized repeat protein (TIGR01451 family)